VEKYEGRIGKGPNVGSFSRYACSFTGKGGLGFGKDKEAPGLGLVDSDLFEILEYRPPKIQCPARYCVDRVLSLKHSYISFDTRSHWMMMFLGVYI
jgi:hypothetical protein